MKNMKLKRAFSWLLVCMMLTAMLPPAGAASSSGARGHWAAHVIDQWSAYGVLQGDRGTLDPEAAVTRGGMAAVIDALLAYQDKAEDTFSDLDGNANADAVLRAVAAGVLADDVQALRPDEPITREEAVCMLARALSVASDARSTDFADNASISDWAMADVAAFAQQGYLRGKPGNCFDPQAWSPWARSPSCLTMWFRTISPLPARFARWERAL